MTQEQKPVAVPATSAAGPSRAAGKTWFVRVLDAIGSVTFGITMLVLVLLWSWIGSAGTAPFGNWFVRQTFEKTEMEWFAWWPFNLVLLLLGLSLVLVTVRKIPLNWPNAGVWTIHAGVVVLMVGCAIYFGLKTEGDMAVYRRQAVVQIGDGPKTVVQLQGGVRERVAGNGRSYIVEVGDLNPQYELLTGADKGKKTYSAQLTFHPESPSGVGQTFIRQVLVGYPQYTEDVVPGRGRAVKVLGRPIVDDSVKVQLEYAATDRMFIHDRPALHVRPSGSDAWFEYAVRGLPRYHDYVTQPGDAYVRPGEPALPLRPLKIAPRPKGDIPAGLAGIEWRVTGFLPFAQLNEYWEAGGTTPNPYLNMTVEAGSSRTTQELLANVPGRQSASLGAGLDARFLWLDDAAALAALLNPGSPQLVVRVPTKGIEQAVDLAAARNGDVEIRGAGFKVHLSQYYPSYTLPATGDTGSMAVVRVSGPGRSFLRSVVAPRADLSEDLDEQGQRLGRLADPSIQIALRGVVQPGLWLVGGAAGNHALLVNQGGQVLHQAFTPGQQLAFLDGALKLTVNTLSPTARKVEKPVITPRRERDAKAGMAYSMIQVEASAAGQSTRFWIDYSHYAHPSRLGYSPRYVTFADGRTVEILFSRESLKLPAPVALEDFELVVYPGGQRERDFVSRVRFFEKGAWTDLHKVHSNNPTEHDGWWYFQSTWDPPEPSMGYAGMNYTGLGVGNRHGVGIMLLGSMMTVLGTVWAFYVKPVILRRRVRTILEARARAAAEGAPAPADEAAAEGDEQRVAAGGNR